eukprot:2408852-Rhodomonas_salina.4
MRCRQRMGCRLAQLCESATRHTDTRQWCKRVVQSRPPKLKFYALTWLLQFADAEQLPLSDAYAIPETRSPRQPK